MRCESHISNGISTCHFTLFSTLTPCMLMPTQTRSACGASGAGSTYLVWLRFWREAQRRRMSSEFTQGLCQFHLRSNGNHRDPGLIQQNAALYYSHRSRSVFPFWWLNIIRTRCWHKQPSLTWLWHRFNSGDYTSNCCKARYAMTVVSRLKKKKKEKKSYWFLNGNI